MKTPRYQRGACERDKIEREFRRLLDEKLGRKYWEKHLAGVWTAFKMIGGVL